MGLTVLDLSSAALDVARQCLGELADAVYWIEGDIVATFAEDGPDKCSGLPVVRYRPDSLLAEFGEVFLLLGHEQEAHHTPVGKIQQFVYCYCRKGNS